MPATVQNRRLPVFLESLCLLSISGDHLASGGNENLVSQVESNINPRKSSKDGSADSRELTYPDVSFKNKDKIDLSSARILPKRYAQ